MSADTPLTDDRRTMLIALAGAGAISFAPLLYKLSETNPATGAFFRMAYAVPLLFLIVFLSKKQETRDIRSRRLTFLAGLIIAFDFLAYHSAIDYVGTGNRHTSRKLAGYHCYTGKLENPWGTTKSIYSSFVTCCCSWSCTNLRNMGW